MLRLFYFQKTKSLPVKKQLEIKYRAFEFRPQVKINKHIGEYLPQLFILRDLIHNKIKQPWYGGQPLDIVTQF